MMQDSAAGLRIAPALLRPVCGSEIWGESPHVSRQSCCALWTAGSAPFKPGGGPEDGA